MTIGRRLALAFSTILVLLAVNQAIQLWSASLRTASVAALNRALQRQIVLADVKQRVGDLYKQMSLLAQVETAPGQATPDIDSPAPAIDRAAADIARLVTLTDPADLAPVVELQKAYAQLGEDWKRSYDYMGSEQAFAVAFQIKADPLGRRVLLQLVPELQTQVTERAVQAQARFAAVTRLTTRVGLSIFVLSMIVSIAVAYRLARHLRTRLADLAHGASAIAAMDLSYRIPVTSRDDELAAVAGTFNEMAESLAAAQAHLAARNEEILQQQKVAQGLLLNILPEQVAAELAARGEVAPRYFEDVTILFTDFVGFTLATEKLAAEEVVTVLHGFFKAFDEIIARYGLEKMKTIGDSYFCVGGLPVRTPSHPVDATLAAFEMIREVESRALPDGSRWQVRIGLHTGPVVAGVVGSRKFAFDVWGDTVNLGSRMESGGSPNRINVSAAVHQRIKDFFVMENRGRILTKEKKALEMYSVVGVLPMLAGGGEAPPPAFARRYRTYFDKDLAAFPACLLTDGAVSPPPEAADVAPADVESGA
ncbi:MAG TPA: adenylate/guanylate cyclase domain-containing protein [Vicinamibacterales bacterium]|jgi:class 3 adenylate cyclase|nr:adenylate/guanylate cyclase domain-containing protein [Vicinamibacterales bacterium]